MISGDDFLGLLVLFGVGYIFYKKLIEGTNVLDGIKSGTKKLFNRDRHSFGRFKP